MRGPELFDGDHPLYPPLFGSRSLPDVLMLTEVEPVRLGPRYHTVVCVRTRKHNKRIYPTTLASLDFGLQSAD